MMDYFETICAPATVPGTGAITVIRVSGSEALRVCDAVLKCAKGCCSDATGYTIKRADALDVDGTVIDDVLVSVFHAPHSYTGEDSAEISCHASSYIVTRLLERLCSAGARSALPGEFTRRAFINGKLDLAQAEAVADIISSNSSASHKVALNQLRGGYSAELAKIRSELLDITALLELELDFSEEDVEFADRSKLRSLVGNALSKVSSLAQSFHLGNAIKNGIPVVIAGEPNTGKSTLLNALLGEQRAIISPIAGTTRDTIEETMTIDGILFRFIDTAGLRESKETVEMMGIERTRRMIEKADIVLGLVDGSRPEAELEIAKSSICSEVDLSSKKLILLVNKIDLNKNVKAINNFVLSNGTKVDTLYISAKNSDGLDLLRTTISKIVKDQVTSSQDQVLVTNIRHYEALRRAQVSLSRVSDGLATSLPSDLIAQDLREALSILGEITGEISTDEVLSRIFSKFCIGK